MQISSCPTMARLGQPLPHYAVKVSKRTYIITIIETLKLSRCLPTSKRQSGLSHLARYFKSLCLVSLQMGIYEDQGHFVIWYFAEVFWGLHDEDIEDSTT